MCMWYGLIDTPGNFDILYRRSVDGGTYISNVIKNLSSNAGISLNRSIAVSGNNVHVVWVMIHLGTLISYTEDL